MKRLTYIYVDCRWTQRRQGKCPKCGQVTQAVRLEVPKKSDDKAWAHLVRLAEEQEKKYGRNWFLLTI